MQSWTDIITERVKGSRTAVTHDGVPYILLPLSKTETVELFFTIDGISLPFSVWFRRRDELGAVSEERLYAQCGTRELAERNMLLVADLRLNSLPVLIAEDGE